MHHDLLLGVHDHEPMVSDDELVHWAVHIAAAGPQRSLLPGDLFVQADSRHAKSPVRERPSRRLHPLAEKVRVLSGKPLEHVDGSVQHVAAGPGHLNLGDRVPAQDDHVQPEVTVAVY